MWPEMGKVNLTQIGVGEGSDRGRKSDFRFTFRGEGQRWFLARFWHQGHWLFRPLTEQRKQGGWVCSPRSFLARGCSRMARKSSSVRPSKTPEATEGCLPRRRLIHADPSTIRKMGAIQMTVAIVSGIRATGWLGFSMVSSPRHHRGSRGSCSTACCSLGNRGKRGRVLLPALLSLPPYSHRASLRRWARWCFGRERPGP